MKLCRKQSSQGFHKNPGTPSPHRAPGVGFPLDRGRVGEWWKRGYGPQNYYFNPGVGSHIFPRGASSWPRRRMQINFVLSLQTWAASPPAQVTATGRAAQPLPASPSQIPSTWAPFSKVGMHRSRRDPPHPPTVRSRGTFTRGSSPFGPRPQKGHPALTFICGIHPGTGDSVANPKEKRKEDKIENPSHGSPVPTLLLPLLSQWNKCLS